MAHDKENIMVISISPSGAGKTTITKKFNKSTKTLKFQIIKTRSPRSNEIDGVDYHFVHEKFKKFN